MPEPITVLFKIPWLLIIRVIPGWFLRRAYPPERMARNFGVEFLSPRALSINLQSPDPRVDFYLRYVNRNPIWFRVDRVHVQVTVAHHQLGQTESHERI